MAQQPTNDPEPWACIDEEGNLYRANRAHEDGTDENGRIWEGWTYSPRSDEELRAAGYDIAEPVAVEPTNLDPEPWVCMDEDNKPYRTRQAHEDGVDEHGQLWEGWLFQPRSYEELRNLGLV